MQTEMKGERSPIGSIRRIGRNSSVNNSIGMSSKRNILNNSSVTRTQMERGNMGYIEEEPSQMNDPYQDQIDEEQEKEHRMLDMINKVQMFQIACNKVNKSF